MPRPDEAGADLEAQLRRLGELLATVEETPLPPTQESVDAVDVPDDVKLRRGRGTVEPVP